MNKDLILGVMIPFIGTTLGAACVYIMKNELKERVQKGLSGFAAGVMVAASIWSLLMPAMDMVIEKMDKMAWIPAAVGFLVGIAFLLFLDSVIPHQHIDSDHPEGMRSENLRKTTMMVLAVIIHNIPEGMAVGVSFAGVLYALAIVFENILTIVRKQHLLVGLYIVLLVITKLVTEPFIYHYRMLGAALSFLIVMTAYLVGIFGIYMVAGRKRK